MKTFLFYDIETSGLNPAFDQVLTFAGIRTDLELNEIDRHSITVRLRKDIIPSPGAFLTHGLTLDQLEKGICEYDAAIKIHALLNTPGTISAGYNSLGFDDEFLRFLFYRNLLDPYTHQYQNGCSRADILPLTVIYRLFSQNNLKWPKIDGKPSLRLELISKENSFVTSGKAHEAMADVEALVCLCRHFIQKREIWNYSLDFFNKARDEARIAVIKKEFKVGQERFPVCLMVSPSFGSAQNYLAPVVRLGESLAYKNQSLWLRLDSEDVLGKKARLDVSDVFVLRKRAADAYIVLPMLDRFREKLPETLQKKADENMKIILENKNRFLDLISYHKAFKYPLIPDLDLDAALYQDGFFSVKEKNECLRFHNASADQKQSVTGQIKSPRIRQLALRIMSRNFENHASQDTIMMFKNYINRLTQPDENGVQVIGFKNDEKRTGMKALDQISDIRQGLEEKDGKVSQTLEWMSSYIREL